METIDLTPTWPEALRVYLFALENGTAQGKAEAKRGLEHMAKVAQMYVEIYRQIRNPELYVFVRGGNVIEVRSTVDNLQVTVVDYDNEDGNDDKIDANDEIVANTTNLARYPQ